MDPRQKNVGTPAPESEKPQEAPAKKPYSPERATLNHVAARSIVEGQGILFVPTAPVKAVKLSFPFEVEYSVNKSILGTAGSYLVLDSSEIRVVPAEVFEAGYKRRFKHKEVKNEA